MSKTIARSNGRAQAQDRPDPRYRTTARVAAPEPAHGATDGDATDVRRQALDQILDLVDTAHSRLDVLVQRVGNYADRALGPEPVEAIDSEPAGEGLAHVARVRLHNLHRTISALEQQVDRFGAL